MASAWAKANAGRWWTWTRSLRWRIQAWYAAILVLSLLAFGSMLHWEATRSTWADVDRDLLAGARILDGAMRMVPPPILDGFRDRPMRRGPPNGGPREGGPRDGERSPFWGPGRVPPSEREFENPQRGPRRPRDPSDSRPESHPPPPSPPFPPEFMPAPPSESPDFAPQPPIDWGAFDRLAPNRLLRPEVTTYQVVWGPEGMLMHHRVNSDDDTSLPRLDLSSIRTNRNTLRTRGSFREAIMRGPGESIICVGTDVQPEIDRMRRFSWLLALSGLGVSALGLAGGAWCLQKTLRPMRDMQATANTIRSENLGQRFDSIAMDTELAQFATSINAMLDRLESGFEQQRQFTADASHELRTPLAIMLSSTELALSRPRTAEVYRSELEKCQRAAERMKTLVDALLTLSRMDSTSQSLAMEPLDFAHLCEDQLGHLEDLAAKHHVAMVRDLEPCTLAGNSGTLERLVANLLINAIVYNREGGTVEMTLRTQAEQAVLTVKDTGIGIPESELSHLFKRFYRVDKARSRQTGGSGLGLAICDTIVQLHRGSIEVESTLGQGTMFQVRLPMKTA